MLVLRLQRLLVADAGGRGAVHADDRNPGKISSVSTRWLSGGMLVPACRTARTPDSLDRSTYSGIISSSRDVQKMTSMRCETSTARAWSQMCRTYRSAASVMPSAPKTLTILGSRSMEKHKPPRRSAIAITSRPVVCGPVGPMNSQFRPLGTPCRSRNSSENSRIRAQ